MISMTKEPESDGVTKKVIITIMANVPMPSRMLGGIYL